MAINVQITCIDKDDRQNPYERITHIGGRNPDGGRWRLTQTQAIIGIKGGKYNFFVEKFGKRVQVIVSTSKYHNKYIKTEADGDEPNNLLSLSSCSL